MSRQESMIQKHEEKPNYFTGAILAASILVILQYVLAFFVLKLPGLRALQIIGWFVWVVSIYFGFAPIFILRRKGGVKQGESYIHTTTLVDTHLYAVVRHPQYLAGMLFNLALMLLAQHWLIFLIGIISMGLIYIDIQAADQEGIRKFGGAYEEYMHRVPQINLFSGLLRVLRKKNKDGL